MGKLWKSRFKSLDIEEVKAAKRNELVVLRENITE